MAARPWNILSLCSGIGSLDLAVSRAVGAARVVCAVEREAYASASLVASHEEEGLDPPPVWTDLCTFEGLPWRGKVDLVTAGLPCQPYSVAGQGKGDADERALWPHFVRIVKEAQPSAVFLENVPKFLRFLGPVWGELRDMGFELAPPLLSTAAEYGAPHNRLRVFVLAAHPDRVDLRDEPGRELGEDGEGAPEPGHAGSGPPNSNDVGREGIGGSWVFDPERQTLRHDSDRCGPGCRICGSEWEAESAPVRLDDGYPDWTDQIRAVGNGVCVPQAEAAFRELAASLVRWEE